MLGVPKCLNGWLNVCNGKLNCVCVTRVHFKSDDPMAVWDFCSYLGNSSRQAFGVGVTC